MRRLVAAALALVLAGTLSACSGFATSDQTGGGGTGGGTGGTGGGASTATTPTRLPDVTLQPLRAGGRAVDTGALRGPVVINLWAQWCGPCRDELPKYEAFHRAHPQVRLLGVDWFETQPARARALAAQVGLTYPLVSDPDRRLGGPRPGLPQLFMIDARGRVVYSAYVEIKSVAQLEGLVRTHLKVPL